MFGPSQFFTESHEGQELTAVGPAASLITQKSSESQIVHVTNKGLVKRYLRVFHYGLHFMVYNRTSSLTYMSE